LLGASGKNMLVTGEVDNNNENNGKKSIHKSLHKNKHDSQKVANEEENYFDVDEADSENVQSEIELGNQMIKNFQQQQQTPRPFSSSGTAPKKLSANNNDSSSRVNLFGLHLRSLIPTLFDTSSLPSSSSSAITAINNAKKTFLESTFANAILSTSNLINNNNRSKIVIPPKTFITLQNGCSKEPLLILSSTNNKCLTQYQYQSELQNELISIAQNEISLMREVAGTAESAALLHPNVIISTISEDVKKEHSIIEVPVEQYLQTSTTATSTSTNNENSSVLRKRSSSITASNNNNNNNSKENNANLALMNLIVQDHRQKQQQQNNKERSFGLRSKIASASQTQQQQTGGLEEITEGSVVDSSLMINNSNNTNNNNQNSPPSAGRKTTTSTSNSSARNHQVLLSKPSKKSNKLFSSFMNQQQNCSEYIQFVQSSFVEVVGNENSNSNNESTEIKVQLAPLQASVGDLLFVVVKIASTKFLMTPGAEEINLSSQLAPLVIPVLVGSQQQLQQNPKSPRK
jgi:hypothetical protein